MSIVRIAAFSVAFAVWGMACGAPAPGPVATPTSAPEAATVASALAAAVASTTAGGAPNTAAVATTTAPAAMSAASAAGASTTAGGKPNATPAAANATPSAGGALIEAALGNLSKTLHPYPDSASYTQPWIDAAALIWGGADGGGALLAFDWDTLDYRPAMAAQMPRVSSDGKTFTFTLRGDLTWSDGSPLTADDFQFAYEQGDREDNRYVQLDLLQDIATYRTPDRQTVEVALKDARPREVALGIVNIISPVPKNV